MNAEQALTPALKSSVNAYVLARAYAETMRERVNEVHREILAECPLYADLRARNGQEEDATQIFESKDLYLCSWELGVTDFYKISNFELRKRGLKPDNMPDDHCPALVAEHLQTKTEWILIEAGAEAIGQEDPKGFNDKLCCAGMDKRREFIDLLCKFVINAPGYRAPNI